MRQVLEWKSFLVKALGISAVLVSVLMLGLLLEHVFRLGWGHLDWKFIHSGPSRRPSEAGVLPALIGSIYLLLLTAVISIPLGVLTALYLEEFAPKTWLTSLIKLNIANLSGVPSIIYGMLGLAFFVRALALGQSLLSGALTMSLLVLPVIIMTSSEAIKAVPRILREGAYGVGATQRQVVFYQVLPESLPGILTGIVLALSRAAGETAPILLAGAVMFTAFAPAGVMDEFTALAVQVFNWSSRPEEAFQEIAATAIIVLLLLTLGLNTLAIVMRLRLSARKQAV